MSSSSKFSRFNVLLAGSMLGCVIVATAGAVLAFLAALEFDIAFSFAPLAAGTGAIFGSVLAFVVAFLIAAVPQQHRVSVAVLAVSVCGALAFVLHWKLAVGIGHV